VSQDRTEKATPKRREDARKKGQLARRPELPAAAGFFAALLALRATGDEVLTRAAFLFKSGAARAGTAGELTPQEVQLLAASAVGTLALLALPVVAAALAAGVAGNFAQGGFTLSPAALKPRAERFNPAANLKRVFGGNNFVELLKSALKLAGLALACYGAFTRAVAAAPALLGSPPSSVLGSAAALIFDLGLKAGGLLFAVALLDYGYGWFQHERSLRMTKQEVRDEYRQQEGDPLMKGQRRRAARALAQRRIATEVPRADVVVTNPTHFAVALRYDREQDAAPVVVAKGADLMARRIRELARRHQVPIVENPPLARSLYGQVEAGRMIPVELFRAVAELLAYVYRQRARARL
jgi:flagellar biosynthesis protein FlhB